MGQLDVAKQVVVQRWVGESENRLWDILTGSLDWDIIIFLKVDTSLLLRSIVVTNTEKLTLNAGIGWAGNVFSITVLSLAAPSWRRRRVSTTSSRIAVCVLVEGRRSDIPAGSTSSSSRRTVCGGGEGLSAGPVATRSRTVSGEAVGSVIVSIIRLEMNYKNELVKENDWERGRG